MPTKAEVEAAAKAITRVIDGNTKAWADLMDIANAAVKAAERVRRRPSKKRGKTEGVRS